MSCGEGNFKNHLQASTLSRRSKNQIRRQRQRLNTTGGARVAITAVAAALGSYKAEWTDSVRQQGRESVWWIRDQRRVERGRTDSSTEQGPVKWWWWWWWQRWAAPTPAPMVKPWARPYHHQSHPRAQVTLSNVTSERISFKTGLCGPNLGWTVAEGAKQEAAGEMLCISSVMSDHWCHCHFLKN